MIFYSGWIDLISDFSDENNDLSHFDSQDNEIIGIVEQMILPLKDYNIICELKQMNWSSILSIISQFNHDNGYKNEIITLFEDIGKFSKNSYGLLYIRELDNPILDNEFQVFRLAKGKLVQYQDLLLSPWVVYQRSW